MAKINNSLLASAALLLGWAGVAAANPVTILNPTNAPTTLVESAQLSNGSATNTYFTDVNSTNSYWGSNVGGLSNIGGVSNSSYSSASGLYSTTQLTASYSAVGNGTVTLVFNTTFAGSSGIDKISNSNSVYAADIFLKSGATSSAVTNNFNYAISLGYTQTADGGLAAGLYKNTSATGVGYKTSTNIWGGTSGLSGWYGSGFASAKSFVGGSPACSYTSPTCNPSDASVISPTVLTDTNTKTTKNTQSLSNSSFDPGSNSTSDVSVCVTGAGCGFNATNDTLTVKLSGTDATGKSDLVALFSDFDIFWGTGDCSNAPIWGNIAGLTNVPEPSSLALLVSAGFGFVIARRRKRKAAAVG